jgi:hypothetical protein
MKNSFAVAAALAAGIGIGSFGVHTLHAQAKPPVYMIEDNTVIDPATVDSVSGQEVSNRQEVQFLPL